MKKNILIVAIVLMTIGFAAVTTNLLVNGSVTIGNSIDDYDIRFTNISLNGVENYELITDEGKRIRFNANIQNSTELIYEVTNNSSLYDAKVSVTCTSLGNTNVASYTIDTTNTPEEIKANARETGSIIINKIDEITEGSLETFECRLSLKSLETAKDRPKYKENLLKGTEPVISGDLIPVVIANDGTVTYADTGEEWYNYENKNWANAVILTENAKAYMINDVIDESDIESYFVWIPKYKYQLWNVESTKDSTSAIKGKHSIEIVFGNENTEDIEGVSCKTPMISGEPGNCDNGEYMTHPAFITFGVNGIWVGKFETGYNGATTLENAQVNDADPLKVIVKPNVYSWRNININNAFLSSYNYNRDLDSHMMKNTEWGAVAYLSHSIYGIDKEININNNSSYKTGYSSFPILNQQTYPGISGDGGTYNQPYNTGVGYLASTTGNISGIYDMNGGTNEYLASHIAGNIGSSEFATINYYNSKYLDVYNESSATGTYQYRILGDATGEIGPFSIYVDEDENGRWHSSWYADRCNFVNVSSPWIDRGGSFSSGVLAGQLNFDRYTGAEDSSIGFRIVLAY